MNEKTEKIKLTKEELSKKSKEYYTWLQKVYSIGRFEIRGKDDEILHFYHGFNTKSIEGEDFLSYYLIDEDYIEYLERQIAFHLQGEEIPESEKKEYNTKGFIAIDKKQKYFNFGIEWDYQRKYGYGRAIYDNYLHILEILGIEDKENYQLRVYGNSNHDFLKEMQTRELIQKTNGEPNFENALQILEILKKYPNSMKLRQLNTIIEYAINSNVPREEIAKAINENGFNIAYSTVNSVPSFEKEDFETFKNFSITGLKATCMHSHFMRGKNFGFMKLLGDIDVQDANTEFKKIFEEVKKEYEKNKEQNGYISPNLERFGELEYIILDWDCSGLLFKYVSPEIQEFVKRQAIAKFDEFDPERRKVWQYNVDYDSDRTLRMLSDAGLMNKDVYIALYQKSLNRNYDLEEFDRIAKRYIDRDERKMAMQEISQNEYYPSPKGKWQTSSAWGENHKISKVVIPQTISGKDNVRDIIKQEILKQGIAQKTKIKTDMVGVTEDGKTFVVDNLKDWMFGVPGAPGNLQIKGKVMFPPQTPKFAVDLIKETLRSIEDPNTDERL